MKLRIEISENFTDDEIIIQCREMTAHIKKLQQIITAEPTMTTQLSFFKDNQEYFFPLKQILFFETSESNVYAHTCLDIFRTKLRLYELEELLPHTFVRISKSAIVNTNQILMVHRNLTSASLIQFYQSHKQVYVSRRYYKSLSQKLQERSYYEY